MADSVPTLESMRVKVSDLDAGAGDVLACCTVMTGSRTPRRWPLKRTMAQRP
jgi:hypothetical protein